VSDQDLRKHLQACSTCAREAKALGLLARLMAVAADGDRENLTPLEDQRALVEERVRQASRRPVPILDGWVKRLQYGGALVTAMIVLVLVGLTPFDSENASGYSVAFGGIDVDLAQDDERICEMLYILGLHEAEVDLLDCDTTCNLLIVDLKTEAEANLVVAAMTTLSDDGITSNVIPITDQGQPARY
jgi:hypothetical protein